MNEHYKYKKGYILPLGSFTSPESKSSGFFKFNFANASSLEITLSFVNPFTSELTLDVPKCFSLFSNGFLTSVVFDYGFIRVNSEFESGC